MNAITQGKLARILVTSAVSAALLYFLLNRIDLSRGLQLHLRWTWCLVFAALVAATNVLRALSFLWAAPETRSHARPLFWIIGIHNFLVALLPFGLGHLTIGHLLNRFCNIGVGNSYGLFGLFTLVRVILLLLLAVAVMGYVGLTTDLDYPLAETAAGATLLLAALLTAARRGLLHRLPLPESLAAKISGVLDGLRSGTEPRTLGAVLIIQTGIIALAAARIHVAALALGWPLGLEWSLLLCCAINLSMILPIHGLGQFGSQEIFSVSVLLLAGLTPSQAAQLGLAIHILQFATQSVLAGAGGLALLFRPGHRMPRLNG